MYISCGNNNGIPYLRLMESITKVNANGETIKTKKSVYNIGPLSRFDDNKPNYLQRLRDSFSNGKPFIQELLPFVELTQHEKEVEMIQIPKYGDYEVKGQLFASTLFDRIFDELGLSQWITLYKSRNKISYDILGLTKLLTYGRILKPASKIATFKQNHSYFDPIVKTTNAYNVYDVLDELQKNRTNLIRRIDETITNKIGRNKELLFYDVTNFYFEIEHADDNYINENGDEQKGLRQDGVSKENRKQPIVQLGLFLDDRGIPVSYEVFPGNTLDQATLRPALKKTIDTFHKPRFILVADRGLSSFKNAIHLIKSENGYIISKSIKKTKKVERDWLLDDTGYIHQDKDFRYKSRIIKRREKDEDDNYHEYEEKVVVYWSRKFYERERNEHKTFVEFLEKLAKNPAGFRVTKKEYGSVKKFLKKEVINKKTGEILDSKDLYSSIDKTKLEQFTAYMGYYQIVTSELECDTLEVIDKYHGLSRIEDQFRVMKSTLETRPVFVRTKEHIEAHLLICFIALVMVRIIQYKIRVSKGKDITSCKDWDVGLSADRIQDALNEWRTVLFPGENYFFMKNDETHDDLMEIHKAFGLDVRKGGFTYKELKEIKSQIQVL